MPKPDRESEDRLLLRRLAAGEPDAVGQLYDRYGADLFAHALWLSKRREDAEDAVHAVFVALIRRGGALLGVRRVREYLHRAVRHAAIDGHRARARGELARHELLLPSRSHDAEDLVELRNVRAALDGLEPPQREAVLLHLLEGFTFREIGRISGVSTYTAASRYRLGIRRVRRALGEEGSRE